VNYEKNKLLQTILDWNKPTQLDTLDRVETEPVKSLNMPWRVRQQLLENEDKQKAQLLKMQQETEKLEKELSINHG